MCNGIGQCLNRISNNPKYFCWNYNVQRKKYISERFSCFPPHSINGVVGEGLAAVTRQQVLPQAVTVGIGGGNAIDCFRLDVAADVIGVTISDTVVSSGGGQS